MAYTLSIAAVEQTQSTKTWSITSIRRSLTDPWEAEILRNIAYDANDWTDGATMEISEGDNGVQFVGNIWRIPRHITGNNAESVNYICRDNRYAASKLFVDHDDVDGGIVVYNAAPDDEDPDCVARDYQVGEIIEDIRNEGLEGLVVASCSPKLHVPTFRDVARRAGLNPYKYVQVNIREQSSWAHSDQPGLATEKAIQMIRAGISKVRYVRALDPILIGAENAVAIVGAGITGIRAAMGLAALGTKVFLLEKDH